MFTFKKENKEYKSITTLTLNDVVYTNYSISHFDHDDYLKGLHHLKQIYLEWYQQELELCNKAMLSITDNTWLNYLDKLYYTAFFIPETIDSTIDILSKDHAQATILRFLTLEILSGTLINSEVIETFQFKLIHSLLSIGLQHPDNDIVNESTGVYSSKMIEQLEQVFPNYWLIPGYCLLTSTSSFYLK